MESQRIATTIERGVAHVELARPERMNAMDGAMFDAIGDTFRRLGASGEVRAILLSGQGKHFTAGIDLHYAGSQFKPAADAARTAEARLRHVLWLQECFSAVERARVPVIAAIQGGCIGAGVDLASACDIRIAAEGAFFQIAEVEVAITADLGTLQRLSHLLPGGIVRELAYTGRRMEAEEAGRFGFVNRIEADADAAVATGLEMARTIAGKSPIAVTGTKMSLNYSRGRPVEDGLGQVALWNASALGTDDLAAAVGARLAKSSPQFPPLED